MLNKKDIDEKKFESSFRGYSKEEVDDFLDEVSASVGEMTAAFSKRAVNEDFPTP